MPRKYDKRWLVDRLTALRGAGFSRAQIQRIVGIANSHMNRIIKDHQIPRGQKCPHCLVDLTADPVSNQTAGEVRPKET